MKIKFLLAILLTAAIFSFAQPVFAVTETATLIAQIQAQIAQLQAQLTELVQLQASSQNNVSVETGSSWCHTFNKNMVKGDTGDEVKALQIAMAKQGYDVSADTSGIFGNATYNAVIKFQEKYASEILTPFGLLKGNGAVYAKTRFKLNLFYTCDTQSDLTDVTDDGNFSISITSPAIGQRLTGGDVFNISWTSTGASNETLDIFLTDYSSTPVSTVIKTGVLISSGTFAWTVPTDLAGNKYKILLNVTSKSAQVKSNTFSIISNTIAHFTSPNENSKWYIGEKYLMNWRLPNSYEYQTVALYLVDSADNKTAIISKYTTGRNSRVGGYTWTVPASVVPGDYRLFVEGSACSNTASSYSINCDGFTAYSGKITIAAIKTSQPTIKVLTPTAGETLTTYSTYNITWQQENLEGYKVDITATSTQGREQPIATGVDASLGTYAYSIPPAMGGGQVWNIKVSSNFTTSFAQIKTGSGYTFAYSSQFKVNHGKKIKVEAPNGGQTLNYDTTYNIRWITGNITTVNIYLVNSSTGAQYTVATNVPSATTDFIYSYPFKPTAVYPQGNYKFLIADSSDATIKDYSDGTFAIGTSVACVENWDCTEWSACVNSTRTKVCKDLNSCGTTINKPVTSEYCSTWSCTPNWTCTWSACVNGWQTARCTDSNNCGTVAPSSSKPCTSCTPSWSCEWGECINGYRSKVIVDKNNCGQSSSTSGIVCTTEVASCTSAGSSVTTVTPNGSEILYKGDTYQVKWTSNGLSTVNINLQNYSTGGLYYSIARNVSASAGVYSWKAGYTVDNVAVPSGEKYKILIGYGDKNDYSDNYFTIADRNAPTIKVNSPNGGENWSHGSTHTITWTAANMGNINIFAKNVSTGVSATIAANIPSSTGSYTWTLPPTSTAATYSLSAGQYKIWIVGTELVNWTSIEDYSDSSITISNQVVEPPVTVVSPNGGETLTQNTSAAISWETSGITGYGLVVYLKNMDTGTLYAIKTGSTATAGTSSYSWEVPSTVPAGNRYKIRVYAWDSIGNSVEDYSDGYVTVATGVQYYIKLNSPNGGEQLTKGMPYNITWSTNYSSPTTNTVNIYLTMSGALNETTIATNIPVSAGSYTWTPQWTGNAKVRVQYVALTDSSDGTFTVSESAVKSLTLKSPNGGELWYKDTQYSITWSAPNVSKINIYLEEAYTGGKQYTVATGVTASNGLYYWKIPTTYTNNIYKVLIVDASDSSLKDYSNSLFTIISRAVNPAITVISPNGSQSLKSGDIYNITWDSVSLTSNSKIRVQLWDEDSSPAQIQTLATGLSSTVKNFSWTVPSGLKAGKKYRIKLQVYQTTSTGGEIGVTADFSDTYFSVNATSTTPTLEVLTPTAYSSFLLGGSLTTTWTATNISKATIKLVSEEYTNEEYTVGTDVDGSLGTYRFAIPTAIEFPYERTSRTFRVLIIDQNSTLKGYSPYFYIKGRVPMAIEDLENQIASISAAIVQLAQQLGIQP